MKSFFSIKSQSALFLTSMLLLLGVPQSAEAKDALCVIKLSSETIFRGKCNFNQFGGNGSFWIEAKSGLIVDRESISVNVTTPGVAEVYGVTTSGINSRWGQVRRSNSDRACWGNEEFTICVY